MKCSNPKCKNEATEHGAFCDKHGGVIAACVKNHNLILTPNILSWVSILSYNHNTQYKGNK